MIFQISQKWLTFALKILRRKKDQYVISKMFKHVCLDVSFSQSAKGGNNYNMINRPAKDNVEEACKVSEWFVKKKL